MENKLQKHIRIEDSIVANKIDELLTSKKYTSFNELINHALKIGVDELYNISFGTKEYIENTKKSYEDRIENLMGKISADMDETLVYINIIKALMTTIYNIEYARVKGEKITQSDIDYGGMSDLPEYLKDVENKVMMQKQKIILRGKENNEQ